MAQTPKRDSSIEYGPTGVRLKALPAASVSLRYHVNQRFSATHNHINALRQTFDFNNLDSDDMARIARNILCPWPMGTDQLYSTERKANFAKTKSPSETNLHTRYLRS
jgi:hypothetical protein